MKRILLVTEHCKKHSLPLVLAHAGYDVIEPRVPSDAAKLARTQKFDLVVLGHCIPTRTRETIAQLIRVYQPLLPIIAVAEDPVTESPTGGSHVLTSCETMLWAIEHAVRTADSESAAKPKLPTRVIGERRPQPKFSGD